MATTYLKLFEVIGSYWLLLVVITIQEKTGITIPLFPFFPISRFPEIARRGGG